MVKRVVFDDVYKVIDEKIKKYERVGTSELGQENPNNELVNQLVGGVGALRELKDELILEEARTKEDAIMPEEDNDDIEVTGGSESVADSDTEVEESIRDNGVDSDDDEITGESEETEEGTTRDSKTVPDVQDVRVRGNVHGGIGSVGVVSDNDDDVVVEPFEDDLDEDDEEDVEEQESFKPVASSKVKLSPKDLARREIEEMKKAISKNARERVEKVVIKKSHHKKKPVNIINSDDDITVVKKKKSGVATWTKE